MEPKEISVSVSRTINLGSFESERIDVGLTATLGEHDSLYESMESARSYLTAYVKRVEMDVRKHHPDIETKNIGPYESRIYTTHKKRVRGTSGEERVVERVINDQPNEKDELSSMKDTDPEGALAISEAEKKEKEKPPKKPVSAKQQKDINDWWKTTMSQPENQQYVRFFVRAYKQEGYESMAEIPTFKKAREIWEKGKHISLAQE